MSNKGQGVIKSDITTIKSDITTIKSDITENCFVISNILSKDECKNIIDKAQKKLWDKYNPKYRNNEILILPDKEIIDIIWPRVVEYLTDCINESEVWRVTDAQNNKTKVMKYIIIYLNDEYDGGETILYTGKSKPIAINPRTGMCVVFDKQILNEKASVKNGLKYYIRYDICYKKIGTDIQLTSNEKKAYKIYETGVSLEKIGNVEDALKCYMSSLKICSNIADLYNKINS